MAKLEASRVRCYSGYTYAQKPRTFVWRGQCYCVIRVERQWRTPAGPVFRVRVADGRRFTLAYDEAAVEWDVHLVHGASGQVT